MKLSMAINRLALFVVCIVLTVKGYALPSFSTGLLAYYPFNGNANDATGNGYHASVHGNYQYLSDGTLHLIGDGALFYSGGGYVALPDYGNLNSGFTMSLWVGGESDHGNSIFAEYYLWLDNNITTRIHISQHDFGIGSPLANMDFPYAVSDYTQWKQLTLSYSPASTGIYLNGVRVGGVNNVTFNPFPVVNAAIGRHWWAGGANSSARMSMDVKNFRVYDRALSDEEVVQLYRYESRDSVGVPDSASSGCYVASICGFFVFLRSVVQLLNSGKCLGVSVKDHSASR